MLFTESVSPGFIRMPLNLLAASPILCILEGIDPVKREVPLPMSSLMPRLFTSPMETSGFVLVTGTSIVEIFLSLTIKSSIPVWVLVSSSCSFVSMPSFAGVNSSTRASLKTNFAFWGDRFTAFFMSSTSGFSFSFFTPSCVRSGIRSLSLYVNVWYSNFTSSFLPRRFLALVLMDSASSSVIFALIVLTGMGIGSFLAKLANSFMF